MRSVSVNIIRDDGYGASIGLHPKDVIYRINGKTDICSQDISAAIANGPATFSVIRGENRLEFEIDSPSLGVVLGDIDFDISAFETAEAISTIVLTTSPSIPGKEIQRVVDVVGAQCVYGINVLEDIATGIRDAIGGRSAIMQNRVAEARAQCCRELREAAHKLGANGVVSISFNYSDIGDKGGYMLMATATGTAVIHS